MKIKSKKLKKRLTKKKVPDGDFSFGEQSLNPATEVKWLGVWLDSKLLLNRNFRVLEEKAHKTINQLKVFGNSRWGAKEADRVKLIRSVLFPRILYGAALWATIPNKGKVNALASKINRLSGIFTLGVFKNTSSKFIQHRTVVPDFLDEKQGGFQSIVRRLSKYWSGRKARKSGYGVKPGKNNTLLQFWRNSSQISGNPTFGADPRAVVIFSDGSFHPEKGRAGAAICPSKNVFSSLLLGGDALVSNHESEAAGVLAALGLAFGLSRDTDAQRILILVDNQGVLKRLNDPLAPKPGQKIFEQINLSLALLPDHINVKFGWCPGHKDICIGKRNGGSISQGSAGVPLHAATGGWKQLQESSPPGTGRPLFQKFRLPTPSDLPIVSSSLINQLALAELRGDDEIIIHSWAEEKKGIQADSSRRSTLNWWSNREMRDSLLQEYRGDWAELLLWGANIRGDCIKLSVGAIASSFPLH
ncbi:hypothetical protein PGT21_021307 [Puccinia graminis f. sp. tritici]|uniref:RNase H type-1 domain-containing protein n=1 Tax=Puccinia graminis f. sp. tritici TaxID=56615 RepID=A0A5B0PY63_PUCGR|nr:hypothetical protein PGT21_021307 [Puccinia graminis f. sp. tritici]KAA1135087.1 hypothetical protein PGTUg99_005333 [Puccinia graminis f. sp. tritici]